MKYIFIISICLHFLGQCWSQSDRPSDNFFQISYYGNNLWNPGISVSYDIPFNRFWKSENVSKLYTSGSASYFWDPDSRSTVLISMGIRKRNIDRKNSFSWGINPLGISRTFLQNTYTVNIDGSIEKPSNFKGNFYYTPSIVTSYLRRRQNLGILSFGTELACLIPYNTYILPLINIKIGYAFPIKSKAHE